MATGPALEHHLVEHLVVLLGVAGETGRAQVRQIHGVARQRVVKVAHALLIPDGSRLAIRRGRVAAAPLLARRLVQVVVRVVAGNRETLRHNR